MRIRTATLAAALGLAAAGCGDNPTCNDQTPPVKNVQNCTVAEGAPVTVQIQTCPRCDQSSPRCLVHLENVGSHSIQLEALSEVCDASSSCPIVDPLTCPASPLSCTFTAPAASGSPYDVVVVTPDASTINRTLTVVASGPLSCGFP